MNTDMNIILYMNTNIYMDMDTDTIWILGTGIVYDTNIGYGKSTCPILSVNQLGS